MLSAAIPFTARCAAPVFSFQPSSVTVNVNASATFSASATGALGYQWQVSLNQGTTWMPVDTSLWSGSPSTADTNTLVLPNVPSALSGSYFRCLAWNASGFAISNYASLVVNTPFSRTQLYTASDPGGRYMFGQAGISSPVFHCPVLAQPVTPSSNTPAAAPPSNQTFMASFSGGTGQSGITITWQKSTDASNWSTVSNDAQDSISADGQTLTITLAPISLSGTFYRAVATDNYSTGDSAATNPARLDVGDPICCNADGNEDGTSNGSQVGKVGTNVVFYVYAFGNLPASGNLLFQFQWQVSSDQGTTWSAASSVVALNGTELANWPGTAKASNSLVVHIPDMTVNQYEYRCQVTTNAGSFTSDPMLLTATP